MMTRLSITLLVCIAFSSTLPLSLSTSTTMLRSLRESPTDDLCDGTLDLKTFLFMNKMCEDCFSLYRDSDIYSACRSGCFSSPYFQSCMESLLVDKDTKGKAVGYLRARFGTSDYGFDPLA
eukprot:TRINITY_DN8593_c0_g1_i1.p1 TRINITY_DN8593_c0_g1~~TRINITY_DN8593_c0_g1_i1.p1  ORF type:complete len:121 (+),score=30.51 TRINITY_DN8593_c0_g1_i1:409-771(+)